MRFTEISLSGAFVIDPEPVVDERGSFARTWCRDEFAARGLDPAVAQCSVSYNTRRGTLRGMHYQAAPYAEVKLVRCTRGAIFDVIIDLRPESSTYMQWFSIELKERDRRMLYVPAGFAHGFLTLQDESEVFYQISQKYMRDFARGVRWNDPRFGIRWPEEVRVISERDQNYPDFSTDSHASPERAGDGRSGSRTPDP